MSRIQHTKLTEQLQKQLNETASAQNYELESLTLRTFKTLRQIEEGLLADGAGSSTQLALFCAWIRWLCDWDHYSVALLHRRRLIGHLNRQLGEGRFRLEIYPYMTKLYSIQPAERPLFVQLHEAMDFMDDRTCHQFAYCIASRRWKDLRQLIGEYQASSPQYSDLLAYFRNTKVSKPPVNDTKGRFYDLEAVFQNCNERNFGGKVPRPRSLHWSQRVNHATMGSYNLKEDSVMINRGLDRRDVPAYVLDFIMYHELLHKILGVESSGGRNRAHTPEFRKLEQVHPDYGRAQIFIQKNAKKL